MGKLTTPYFLRYFVMVISDSVAILCAGVISVWVRYIFNGQFEISLYCQLWPVLILFLFVYAFGGLYPGELISPSEELKKVTQASSLCFMALAFLTFMSHNSQLYSRGIFLMSWLLVLFLVPLFRIITRKICCKFSWWGNKAIILGAGKTGGMIARLFLLKGERGIKPIAFFDDDDKKQNKYIYGVKVLGKINEITKVFPDPKDLIMIIAMPGMGKEKFSTILEKYEYKFKRIVLIPDLVGVSTLWASVVDIDGILGLDLRQKLLDSKRQFLKRCLDICLALVGGILFSPIMIIIALLIKLDSKGPIFFRQKRIGLGGKEIYIWKFRTMVQNADEILQEYFRKNPELKKEWEMNQKLINDPRIIKIGKFLRKTSLDELPQLWNVLKGDLSMVGPRPIIYEEIEKYQQAFELYKKVRPGITGLWQISGRNNLSYSERINLDTYYVRNWSIWLDIYILAKTPLEVLKCNGAY